MATCNRLIRGALLLSLGVAVAPATAEDENQTAARLVDEHLLFGVVRVEAEFRSGSATRPSEGFGLVVGVHEQDRRFLIATANHVLRTIHGASRRQRVHFEPQHTGVTDPVPARLEPEYEGSPVVDIGFLTVPIGRAQPVVPFPSPAERPPGRHPVWYLGRALTWTYPSTPGTVGLQQARRESVFFEGMPVATGSSGAPLFTVDGVVGLLRQSRPGTGGYATSIATVKALFDENFAGRGWKWNGYDVRPRVPLGSVDVSRTDDLSVTLALRASDGQTRIVLPRKGSIDVKAGEYTVEADGLPDPDWVDCFPDSALISGRERTRLEVNCLIEANGTWHWLEDYRWQVNAVEGNQNYRLQIKDARGRQIGNGELQRKSPSFFEVYGVISRHPNPLMTGGFEGRLRFTPGSAAGKLTFLHRPLEDVHVFLERGH